MGFYISPELSHIAVLDEKQVVCPVCGTPRVVFSGLALTAGDRQIGFDSQTPNILTTTEVSKAPGVFTVSAELLCDQQHSFSYCVALDWEKGEGVTAGTICPKDGIPLEEVEIAMIKHTRREYEDEARHFAGQEGGK